jgi:hypothetical protein
MLELRNKNTEKLYLLCILISSIIILIIILCQPIYVIDGILVDDCYYYFAIARNFSNGKGIVFNNGIPTNGFHPLYFLLLTPIYAIFGSNIILSVYLSVLILFLFNIGTGFLLFYIGKIAYNLKAGVIASLIWLFNPYIIHTVLLGMEVPIQVFFVALSVYYFLKKIKSNNFTIKESAILSIFMSLIILSRLDGIFFVIGIFFSIFYNRISKLRAKRKIKIKDVFRILLAREFIIIFIFPILSVSIWILWSFISVGLLTPSSGILLKGNVTGLNYILKVFDTLQYCLTRVFSIFYYPPGDYLIQAIVFIIFIGIPFLFIIFFWLIKKDKFIIKQFKLLDFLIINLVLFLGFYCLYQLRARDWYILYLDFIFVLFFSLGIAYLIDKSKKIRNNNILKKIRLKKNLKYIITVIFILNFSYNSFEIYTHLRNSYEFNINMINYIENNIPSNKTIGSFNTGLFQYYSLNRDIINLDGLVNIELYKAIVNDNISDYIGENIDYILDYDTSFVWLLYDTLNLTIIKDFGEVVYNPYFPNNTRHYYLYEVI